MRTEEAYALGEEAARLHRFERESSCKNRLKTKLYHPKLLRYLSRTLSSLLPAIAERGERGATRAPTVEVAVPLRLRWPSGPRMCAGTASLCLAV